MELQIWLPNINTASAKLMWMRLTHYDHRSFGNCTDYVFCRITNKTHYPVKCNAHITNYSTVHEEAKNDVKRKAS